MNLILFGFKSCGKTTLGKLLAHHCNCAFIDTDLLIEQLYARHTTQRLSCREIFQAVGPTLFRTLESDVLATLKEALNGRLPFKSDKNVIIAVGGGIILDSKNIYLLAQLGQLIYLSVSRETLKRRILGGELPAYLDPKDPEGSFEQMYTERLPKYEAVSALSVDLETKTQDEILQKGNQWLAIHSALCFE